MIGCAVCPRLNHTAAKRAVAEMSVTVKGSFVLQSFQEQIWVSKSLQPVHAASQSKIHVFNVRDTRSDRLLLRSEGFLLCSVGL